MLNDYIVTRHRCTKAFQHIVDIQMMPIVGQHECVDGWGVKPAALSTNHNKYLAELVKAVKSDSRR